MPNARHSQIADVDGRRIQIHVDILDPPDRARLAAGIAWLAEQEGEAGRSAWEAFATDVVGAHVDFTIDDQDLRTVDGIWWARAIYSAAAVLMDVNELAPDVRRSLATLHETRSVAGDVGPVC